jgi:hypothetical protein
MLSKYTERHPPKFARGIDNGLGRGMDCSIEQTLEQIYTIENLLVMIICSVMFNPLGGPAVPEYNPTLKNFTYCRLSYVCPL